LLEIAVTRRANAFRGIVASGGLEANAAAIAEITRILEAASRIAETTLGSVRRVRGATSPSWPGVKLPAVER